MDGVKIGLLGLVVILLLAIGYMFFYPINCKEPVYDSTTCAAFIKKPVYDSSTCAAFIKEPVYNSTTCAAFAPTAEKCSVGGFCPMAQNAAQIETRPQGRTRDKCIAGHKFFKDLMQTIKTYYAPPRTILQHQVSSDVLKVYEGQTEPSPNGDIIAWTKLSTTTELTLETIKVDVDAIISKSSIESKDKLSVELPIFLQGILLGISQEDDIPTEITSVRWKPFTNDNVWKKLDINSITDVLIEMVSIDQC